jgi:hypothetical protein
VDVIGYQSGHRGHDAAWRWLAGLPQTPETLSTRGMWDRSPAMHWREAPGKIAMNLEPCYEDHNRMEQARNEGIFERYTDEDVRRAMYWSLLVTPTAGVTYGGHGVWGWDEGTEPPLLHPLTGTPRRWSEALHLPGAEQLRHLRAAFELLEWWRLRPDPALVREPLTGDDARGAVVGARTDDGRTAVIYAPAGPTAGRVSLDLARLASGLSATWVDPRTGDRQPASGSEDGRFDAPDGQDWLLILRASA